MSIFVGIIKEIIDLKWDWKDFADGTPTEPITIGSTNTTPFNFVYAGTGYHQVNYCNISYCNATANKFYAEKTVWMEEITQGGCSGTTSGNK